MHLRRQHIQSAAAALVQSGTPSGSLLALDHLVTPDAVRSILRHRFEQTGRVGDRLERYLAHYRPVFLGSDTHAGLWASAKGCPMKGGAIYDAVCRRTNAAFGRGIYLHLFRDAAATFWSVKCPEAILGARDLLGHRNLDTTDRHYRHAQTVQAARQYAQILERRVRPVANLRPLKLRVGKRRRHSLDNPRPRQGEKSSQPED